jgi:hypothetical protein
LACAKFVIITKNPVLVNPLVRFGSLERRANVARSN